MTTSISPPSAKEISRFVAELSEEEVYVLPCGGGAVTSLAHSVGWLRWIHGQRQLLRLAVHLLLSSPPDQPDMPDDLARADDILFRYADRRLLRDLIELREEWTKRAAAQSESASEKDAGRSSRLQELIKQVDTRLQIAERLKSGWRTTR